MKFKYEIKTIIFLLIFVTCYNKSLSQEFAPIGATWNFPETFAFSSNINTISFESIGDTIINNKIFKIINKDKYSCSLRFQDYQFICEKNDSIFHLNRETEELNLIIDFGATANSSWFIKKYENTEYADGMNCKIDSVKTESIDGRNFKIQYATLKPIRDGEFLGDSLSTRIIEGIGFEQALFPVIFSYVCDGNFEKDIRCYEDENLGLVKFTEEECLLSGTIQIKKEEIIEIYPNPTNSIIYIQSNNSSNFKEIKLFQSNGTLIKTEKYSNILDISEVPTGVYYIAIIGNNQRIVNKLVVVK